LKILSSGLKNAKVKTRQSVEGPFGSEFPAVCNHCWVTTA